jgi:GntR family transcriptional regulator
MRVEGGQVTESVGRPAYQEVADDLRRRIVTGDLAVGAAIPSTANLIKAYGVSSTVVRAAVAQLRGDGLLVGQPGKGVFVRATPASVTKRAASIDELSQQVGVLRGEMREIRERLIGLYDILGKPYPGDGRTADKPSE